jgi:hypothetical protein
MWRVSTADLGRPFRSEGRTGVLPRLANPAEHQGEQLPAEREKRDNWLASGASWRTELD